MFQKTTHELKRALALNMMPRLLSIEVSRGVRLGVHIEKGIRIEYPFTFGLPLGG